MPPRASNPERRRRREVVGRAEGERHGRTQQYLQLVDRLSGCGEREEQGPPRRGNWRGWRAGGRRSRAVAANRRRAYYTGGTATGTGVCHGDRCQVRLLFLPTLGSCFIYSSFFPFRFQVKG